MRVCAFDGWVNTYPVAYPCIAPSSGNRVRPSFISETQCSLAYTRVLTLTLDDYIGEEEREESGSKKRSEEREEVRQRWKSRERIWEK